MDDQRGKNIWPFEDLPEEIRSWLRSDNVIKIVDEVNAKFGFSEEKKRVVPFMVTWIVIKTIRPEEFIQTLMNESGLSLKTAQELAEMVRVRILRPIKGGLKSLGVDIDKVTQAPPVKDTSPQATTMKIEDAPPRTVDLKNAPPEAAPKQVAQPAVPVKPTAPEAEKIHSDQPFHLTEQNPVPQQSQSNTGT